MLPSILIIDDEKEVLKALQRELRHEYNIHLFQDPYKAINFYKKTPTQLIISDMRMPVITGAEFLKKTYEINSRSKRVVLSGDANTELVIKAINDGHVSAYINKPWNNEELKTTLSKLILELKTENKKISVLKKLEVDNQQLALNQKLMNVAVKDIQNEYEHTVEESTHLKHINAQLLHLNTHLISMHTDTILGHTYRIAHQARALANRLKLKEIHCIRVYLAALFYRIGFHSLPKNITHKAWHMLSQQEKHLWLKFPQASADIIASIDILKASANIVRHLFEHVDGSGVPERLNEKNIPTGSKILAILTYFDSLVAGNITGKFTPPKKALTKMESLVDQHFERNIFNTFVSLIEAPLTTEKIELPKAISDLEAGMIISHDIMNLKEQKILSEKTILTEALIDRLFQYQKQTKGELIVYIKV